MLGRWLSHPKLRRGLFVGRVLGLWPEVVGEGLARLTEPFRFEQGVLWVRVKDAVLAHQLTYQRPLLLTRFAHRLGEGVVRELRFVVGPVRKPREKPLPPPPPAPIQPPPRELLELVDPLPSPLKEAALRLGQGVYVRRRTAPACPICQAPNPEGGVCMSCRLRLESPLVRAEAERLLQGHPPRLEGDLQAAARYRALESLWQEITALLPEAAKDPGASPRLLEATLRWLSLKHGRPPRYQDLEELPAPLASLLRRQLGGA